MCGKKGGGGYFLKAKRFLGYFAVIGAVSSLAVYVIYLFPVSADFYLKGLRSVYSDISSNYYYYLNGNFSKDGWWYYFIFAFLIKTPIPALVAFAASLVAYKKYKLTGLEKQLIFIPVTVFLLVTSFKAENLGVRYILPVYPFLILYAGGLADLRFNLNKKVILIFTAGLGVWYVFSAVQIYPDYLAYFNEFVGGPANGYKYLDDSNLEWGQDLKRLRAHQKKHPDVKVVNSDFNIYFDPRYYGISNIIPSTEKSVSKPSGKYAVNIHFLVRMKELSRKLKDKNLDWLSSYQPIDKIG